MGLMKTLAALAIAGAAAGGGGFLWLTAPERLPDAAFAPGAMLRTGADGVPLVMTGGPDPARGARLFHAGGCASCHAAPGDDAAEGAEADAPRLPGGMRFHTEFGTFVAPNISPHPDGIGGWSDRDFADALLRGVSPDGAHYYPAFPWLSYASMKAGDAADIHAFLKTLPPVAGEAPAHELGFPFNIRRGLGLWKLVYGAPGYTVSVPPDDAVLTRGRFLVEAPGHCAECHTPRDQFGGLDRARWLKGAPNPDGPGRVPDISPTGIGDWSAEDIAYYLESGFTPEYDSVGGSMVNVVKNMGMLSAEDRDAVAAYLKALPE